MDWAATISALGPPAARERILRHARSYTAREDPALRNRMAQLLSRLEHEAKTNLRPVASLAALPLEVASASDVGREIAKGSATDSVVPTSPTTGQSRKRPYSSVPNSNNTEDHDAEFLKLKTSNDKPDGGNNDGQAGILDRNEAARMDGYLQPQEPATRVLAPEEPELDQSPVLENAVRARLRYRARRAAAIAVRYSGLLRCEPRASSGANGTHTSGTGCAQLTTCAPEDADEGTKLCPTGPRPRHISYSGATPHAEKTHINSTPSGSVIPAVADSFVDPVTQISAVLAASDLGQSSLSSKVAERGLPLVSGETCNEMRHETAAAGGAMSLRLAVAPAEPVVLLDARTAVTTPTAAAAPETAPTEHAAASSGVEDPTAGKGTDALTSYVESKEDGTAADTGQGKSGETTPPVVRAVPVEDGGSDEISPSAVQPHGPSTPQPLPSTRPSSRPATTRAGKAYERHQSMAGSDSDPDRRLDALVRCKMLASRRLLSAMRGQVLTLIQTKVVPPAYSVSLGIPIADVHMAGLQAVAAKKERAAWMAVAKECVRAAAVATRVRTRASSVASSSGGLRKAPTGLASELLSGVAAWHTEALAEAKRRREEAARHRIELLKSSDMQSYLALVRAEKSSRLCEMLQQTDECLRSFARRLGLDKVVAGPEGEQGHDGGSSGAGGTTTKGASNDALLESSEGWGRLATRLAADIPQQPTGLGAQLREYQMHGLRWMVGLHDAGLNGILADDMGLGKTVQVIALIVHLVEVRKQPGPFLIAAPSSVLPNWASELARWAPGLRVVDYRGSAETREKIWFTQICGSGGRHRSSSGTGSACNGQLGFHVLLTSYEFLMGRHDRPRLARLRYSHIIVDEGHRLKNAGCKLNSELAHYRAKSRLLLTGTPLQNRLEELWSLLNFLMPSLFDSGDDFTAWFSAPLDALRRSGGCGSAEGDVAALSQEEYLLVTSRLHQVLRPFMLRRLKESVAGELPAKSEVVLTAALSPYQAALMGIVKNGFERAAGAGGGGVGGSTAVNRAVNNTVMEMRNICNHPFISKLHPDSIEATLPPAAQRHAGLPPLVTLCGKLDLLDRLLVRLAVGRHKVLLFATMTRALDVIEEYLEWRGWESARLDGSTAAAERGALIAEFNAPDSRTFVFLLSLKAGGVGLNLQAADTVILYDTDWNPQLDLQAQARAHRIGQTREVRVFRLLTADSIEQHIAGVAGEKRKFADSSITGGFFDGKTSAEERREYLLKLLAATNTGGGGGGNSGPGGSEGAGGEAGLLSDAELNQLVARGAEEVALLEAEDERRRRAALKSAAAVAAAAAAAAALGATGTVAGAPDGGMATDDTGAVAASRRYSRLLPGDLCDTLVAQVMEANRPKDPDEGKIFGRGMRRVNTESAAGGAPTTSGTGSAGGAGRNARRNAASSAPSSELDVYATATKRREESTSRSNTPTAGPPGFRPPAKVPPPASASAPIPPAKVLAAAPAPIPPAAGLSTAAERTRGARTRQVGCSPGTTSPPQSDRAAERQKEAGGSQNCDGTRRVTRSSGYRSDSQVEQERGRRAATSDAGGQARPDHGKGTDAIEMASCATEIPAVMVEGELADEKKKPSVELTVGEQEVAATIISMSEGKEPSLSQGKQEAAGTATGAYNAQSADQRVSLLDRSPAVIETVAAEEDVDASQMASTQNRDRRREPPQRAAVSLVSPLRLLAEAALDEALPSAGGPASVAPGRASQEEGPAIGEGPASPPGLLGAQLQVSGPRGGKALRGVITKIDPARRKFKYYMMYDKETAKLYGGTGEWGCLDAERSNWLAHGCKRRVLELAMEGSEQQGHSGGSGGAGSQPGGATVSVPSDIDDATLPTNEAANDSKVLASGEVEVEAGPGNDACEMPAAGNADSIADAGARVPAGDAKAGHRVLGDATQGGPQPQQQPQPAASVDLEGRKEISTTPAGAMVQQVCLSDLEAGQLQQHQQPCQEQAAEQPGASKDANPDVEAVTRAVLGNGGGESGWSVEDTVESKCGRTKRGRGSAQPQTEAADDGPDNKRARVEAPEIVDSEVFVGLKARESSGAESSTPADAESTPPGAPLYRVLGMVEGRLVLQCTPAGEAALSAQKALAGGSAVDGSTGQTAAPDTSTAKEVPPSQEKPNAACATTGAHNAQAADQRASLLHRVAAVAAIAHAVRERRVGGALHSTPATAAAAGALLPTCEQDIPRMDIDRAMAAVTTVEKEVSGDRAAASLKEGAESGPTGSQPVVAGQGEGSQGGEVQGRGQGGADVANAAVGDMDAADSTQTGSGVGGVAGGDIQADRNGGGSSSDAEQARPEAPLYRVLGMVQGRLVLQCTSAGEAALAAQKALAENAALAQSGWTVDGAAVQQVAAAAAHNAQAADHGASLLDRVATCCGDLKASGSQDMRPDTQRNKTEEPAAGEMTAAVSLVSPPTLLVEVVRDAALPAAGGPAVVAAAAGPSSQEEGPAIGEGPASPPGLLGAQLQVSGPRGGKALRGVITKIDPARPKFKYYMLYDKGTAKLYSGTGEWGCLDAERTNWLAHGCKRRVLVLAMEGSEQHGDSGGSGSTGSQPGGATAGTAAADSSDVGRSGGTPVDATALGGRQPPKRGRGSAQPQTEAADDGPDSKRARVEAPEVLDGEVIVGLKARVSWGAEGTFRGTVTRYDPKRSRYGLMWLMSYTDGDEEWGAVTEDGNGWRVHRGLRPVTWIGRRPPITTSTTAATGARGPGSSSAQAASAAAQAGSAGLSGADTIGNVVGTQGGGTDYRDIFRRNSMYRAQVQHQGSTFVSPYYDTPEAAAAAADYYNYKLRGTPGHLNLGLTPEQRLVLDQLTLEELQAYIKGRGNVHDLAQLLLQRVSQ